VDTLDLEVRAGEIFGLLGANGAGKTTTILMLLGLTEPTGGGARVVGLDPTRHPLEVKRRVGYLPDSVGFYGDMTAENLATRPGSTAWSARRPKAHRHRARAGPLGTRRLPTDTYWAAPALGIADALIKDPTSSSRRADGIDRPDRCRGDPSCFGSSSANRG
jgi:ABC-2 type transport system ATP-binding protein